MCNTMNAASASTRNFMIKNPAREKPWLRKTVDALNIYD